MAKNLLAICLMFMVASSVIYEVQGTFLLKLYLRRRIPRRCIDFTPFANRGMLMFVNSLEGGCPATREFKQFFVKFKAFMTFINSVSISSSSDVDVEINAQANGLFKACSALDVSNSGKSSSVSDFRMTMLSMAKILIEQKRRGSTIMTFSQRKELIVSMVRWTRIVAQFVKAAAEKRGKSIDISSYGLDVDVNSTIESESSSGGSSDSEDSTSTKTENTNKGSSANEVDSSTPTKSRSSQNSGASYESESSGTSTKTSGTSNKSGSSSKNGSGNTYSDTTGSVSPSGSPTGSPSGSTSARGETSAKGSSSATKTKESSGGSSETTTKTGEESSGSSTKKSGGASVFIDTTGSTSGSPSGSPTGSPSGSTSATGKTSAKGSGSASSMNQESNSESKKTATSGTSQSTTSTTSVKQVESETSKEVMSFISELEKKYEGKSELKVFFEKLRTSMSASSKISTTNAQEFLSTMKSAAGKLAEAMVFVRSRFSKSEETKTSMETCQEEFMKTFKELQEINSEIVGGKTVTSTQKTELKQTITKWEQVTTQFVETATSSSSSSSSSQQSSGTMVKSN